MSTLTLASVVVRSPDQVSTRLGGEVVILGLTSEEYYSLKDVGARIWTLLETPHTVQDILTALVSEYAVAPERCARDLLAVLGEMEQEGLLEVQ